MWAQLLLSKLTDMTFVSSPHAEWPERWNETCSEETPLAMRHPYEKWIGRYTAWHDMRYATFHGRSTEAEEISQKHDFKRRAKVGEVLHDFWWLFVQSSLNADRNLVWPDALMKEIDITYRLHFGDRWDLRKETKADANGAESTWWRETVRVYYAAVTKLVVRVWREMRASVPRSQNEVRYKTLLCAEKKWAWMRELAQHNPYCDFPLPTHGFINDAFTKFAEYTDAIGWVRAFFRILS